MSIQNNVPMAGMNQSLGQRQPQGYAQGQGGPEDVETVRRNYREALYELTFNSKPIITNLTIMAQENQYAAGAIVREIEQQIRHNASGQKLPVLYLIDSICKNVGGVYIEYFARDIASTFLDAYTVTDPNTRRSFERLLQTWKSGMPNGAPVFSRQIIESIERPLNYIRSRNQTQQQQHQQQQQRPHPHQQHYPRPQQQHNHQAQQYQQPRFAQSPQQQAASPRNQQIHVNPNFVPKRDPRDPRSRSTYSPQERQSRPMPPVSQPPAPTQSPSLEAPTNDILSTLQSMLPPPSSSQVMNITAPATAGANSDKGTSDPVAQLVSQIQSILPSLPPDQSGAIQEFLNQILGSNAALSQATIGNMLNNLPFSMPPVSPPVVASTPPVIAPPPAPATSIVGNITRLAHSPPVYRAPAPPVTTAQPLPVPSPVPPQAVAAPQPQPPAALPINTAELLQGLTSMGILSSGGNSATPPPTTAATTTGNNTASDNAAMGSRAAAAAASATAAASGGSSGAGLISDKGPSAALKELGAFRLESKDLQIVRPGAVELLYSGLPLQCKQCGFRYPKTPEGQNKMDAHLDSHFRQNRRMKERVKRGLSRSWFVTEEEWISGSGGELTSHQAPAFLTDSTANEVNMASPSAGGTTDTVNPESHMVVMPNDENRKPCPICGERFVDFWNDDEEEWMYKNAVMVDDTIYHATCHADAVKSGTLVGSDEPEDTEMAESSQGIKRKAEDEDMVKEDVKSARIDEEQNQ